MQRRAAVSPPPGRDVAESAAGERATLTVFGRVVSASGEPVDGAWVEAAADVEAGASEGAKASRGTKASRGKKVSTGAFVMGEFGFAAFERPADGGVRARTDASGAYRLVLPLETAAAASLWLRATAPGYVGAIKTAELDSPSLEADFALREAITVRGRVVDEAAAGVAEATVWTWAMTQRPVRTDAEGWFEIADFDPKSGSGWLGAQADGFQPGYGQCRLPKDGGAPAAVEIELKRAAQVVGTVYGDGLPVPGAQVVLARGKAADYATTDSDGRFRFTRAIPGKCRLTARHDDWAPAIRAVEVGAPGEVSELRVDLSRGREIVGVVRVEGSRAPVASATVSVWQGKSALRSVTTSESGEFRIAGLPIEELRLSSHAPGYLGGGTRQTVPISVRRVELTLRRAARFAGTVLDAVSGEPIPSFEIQVRPVVGGATASPDRSAAAASAAGKSTGKPGTWRWRSGKRAWRSIESPDGQWIYSEDRLELGAVADVVIRAPGYAPFTQRGMVAQIDAEPTDVMTQLSAGVLLRGLVVSAAGEPLAKALVEFESGLQASTEGDGTFEIEGVPHGANSLTITHASHGVSEHALNVREGVNEREHTFRLPHQAALRGVVRDADGQPMPRARLRLTALDAGPASGRSWEDKADAEGRYAFTGLPPGTYRIARVQDGGKPLETLALFVELSGTAERRFDVAANPETSGRLVGELTVPEGSPGTIWLHFEPVGEDADASLALRRSERWVRTEGGVIDVPELTIGRYRIVANSFDERGLQGGVEVEIQPGESAPLTFALTGR